MKVLLIAIAHIEDVVKIIKGSPSSIVAGKTLKETYSLSDRQVEAILEMKLNRLANLEAGKLQKEAVDLKETCERLWELMHNQKEMDKDIISDLERVKSKYGDKRRTKILNLETSENNEPVEKKSFNGLFFRIRSSFSTRS